MEPSELKSRAGGIAWLAFSVAIVCNLIEVVLDPSGWAWTALRATAAVVFLVSALIWLVSWLCSRQSSAASE